MGVKGYENGFQLTLQPGRLEEPLRRAAPAVYFVNSMSDLFHEEVPDSYIEKVLDVMRRAPHHVFQLLTKRAERMAEFFASHEVPDNAWIGVTVEDRAAVRRIDSLRAIDARVRFLSVEPLLEDIGAFDLTGIHWVIVGGESGVRARPMKEEWVVNIKRQCEAQQAAFFFKQWGGWGADGKKRAKKKNGRLLFNRTWDERPAASF